jgi:hypothetical protein
MEIEQRLARVWSTLSDLMDEISRAGSAGTARSAVAIIITCQCRAQVKAKRRDRKLPISLAGLPVGLIGWDKPRLQQSTNGGSHG